MSSPYPPIQPNDKIECKLITLLNSQTCINTFHYLVPSTYVLNAALGVDDLCEPFANLVWSPVADNGIQSVVSSDVHAVAVTAQVIAPTRTLLVPFDLSPQLGEGAAPAAASGVAVVMRRRGADGNRHNFGRIYVAGIPNTDVSESQILAGAVTNWSAAAQTLNSPLVVTKGGTTLTANPCMLSKPALNPTLVVFSTVDTVLRYQRRREVGRGV